MGYVILFFIQMEFLDIVLLHKLSSVLLFACHCSRQDFWSSPYNIHISVPFLAKLSQIHLPSSISVRALATMRDTCIGAKWFIFVIEVCSWKKGGGCLELKLDWGRALEISDPQYSWKGEVLWGDKFEGFELKLHEGRVTASFVINYALLLERV
jgi:hypothetical protein